MTEPKFITVTWSQEAEHEGHVVIDEQDADALGGLGADDRRETFGLGGVEAGRGFIEQQQAWVA